MSFHLFRRPGSIFLLDDDPDYLDLMALLLPPERHVRLFLRPHGCLQHMREEQKDWAADCYRQETVVDLWRQGRPLIPQMLRYWARHPQRYGLTHVGVSDHMMPGLSGLEVFGQLRAGWPGARVLLTGQADERVAVDAFNHGLIDQYIAKQSAEMASLLARSLERLADHCHDRHDAIWRGTLRPQQMALLRQGGAGRALKTLMDREWVEYVVCGDPFGVLGLDAEGHASWLQLQAREALPKRVQDLAKAPESGLPGDYRGLLEQGDVLVAPEVHQSLGLDGPGPFQQAFTLDEGGQLLAALFPLPTEALPEPIQGYRSWLAAQGARRIQGLGD